MIDLFLEDRKLCVRLNRCTHATFSNALFLLKGERFYYNGEVWQGSPFKYDVLKEKLEELDLINDTVDPAKIEESIPFEQKIEEVRRTPDYSLMNYPPITGKAPNENFQHIGIAKGINRSRYAYCWGMGSGKSYVAATIIAHRLYKYHDCSKALFLTTNIGVRNLYHELFKFIKNRTP